MAVVTLLIFGVGLLQGAFILSTFQSMFPKVSKKHYIQRIFNSLQVLPVILIQVAQIWFFVMVFLEAEVAFPLKSTKGWTLIFIAFYLWINMVFNYLAVMIVSPGNPKTREEFLEDEDLRSTHGDFCPKCDRIRYRGTHHCSTCGTCVTLMSHHCPFTNNCIGINNYRHFYLFLVYCNLGLVFSAYCTYDSFMACMYHNTETRQGLFSRYSGKVCTDLEDYPILFLVSVFLLVFMVSVFIYHTVLLLADLSLIEFLRIFQKSETFWSLLKVLWNRVLHRKKFLLRKLVFNKQKKYWNFFLPMINDVDNRWSREELSV